MKTKILASDCMYLQVFAKRVTLWLLCYAVVAAYCVCNNANNIYKCQCTFNLFPDVCTYILYYYIYLVKKKNCLSYNRYLD